MAVPTTDETTTPRAARAHQPRTLRSPHPPRSPRSPGWDDRLEYLGLLGLREILGRLPHPVSLALGARIGRGLGRALRDRGRVARINLGIAFPDLDEAERERILDESFANLGRGAAEWMQMATGVVEPLLARVSIEGEENVEAARRRSPTGGVIALSAHLGNWELGCAAASRSGLPITLVYRSFDNPFLERWVERWRTRAGTCVVARGTAARAALRGLREGRIVVMTLDQNARRHEGVFVPFFGLAASTRAGPARLAARTRVPVVPVFDYRVGDGTRHVVRFQPALEIEPEPASGGREARAAVALRNTARMTRVIEEAVQAAPADWIWSHRRWKTRPAGEPRRYPSRRGRRQAPGRLIAPPGPAPQG